MKWDIWVQPNQIFTENYPDGWSHDDVERAANNRYGGKVTTVSPAPSRGSHESSGGGGGGGSSTGGSGCLLFIGLVALVVFGGFSSNDDKTPTQTPEYAPVERVQAAPAAPAAPQWEDYATPPPSYCVNENFEPC
jgi:hypothetical protein